MVGKKALWWFGRSGSLRMSPLTIVQRLEHSDSDVRNAAVERLAELAPEQLSTHAAALGNKLDDSDWRVREAAVEALAASLTAARRASCS